MIEVRNAKGGTVNVYAGLLNEGKPAGKRWIKRWRLFGLTFAVSNRRVKMREPSKDRWTWEENPDGKRGPLNTMKHKLYGATNGCCQVCGEKHTFKHLQLHHILPFARMSQYATDERNVMLLCHRCHQEIHSNSLRQVEMMQVKASELGVDLKDYYDYGKEATKLG